MQCRCLGFRRRQQKTPCSRFFHCRSCRSRRRPSGSPIELSQISVSEYILVDDDPDLFYCSEELLEVDLSFVVDVKELEALCEEAFLALGGRALLLNLGLHFTLETMDRSDRKGRYSLIRRFIDIKIF